MLMWHIYYGSSEKFTPLKWKHTISRLKLLSFFSLSNSVIFIHRSYKAISCMFFSIPSVDGVFGRPLRGSPSKLVRSRLNSAIHFFSAICNGVLSSNTFFISLKISIGVVFFNDKFNYGMVLKVIHFTAGNEKAFFKLIFPRNFTIDQCQT